MKGQWTDEVQSWGISGATICFGWFAVSLSARTRDGRTIWATHSVSLGAMSGREFGNGDLATAKLEVVALAKKILQDSLLDLGE